MTEQGSGLGQGTALQDYQIQKELGSGSFGITYLALDVRLEKQVVIKEFLPNEIAIRQNDNTVYPKSQSDKENFEWGISRFLMEAKTLAKFNHPNIVKISRFFEANNTAYFVMDYEEGEDLDVYLRKQKKKLTEDEIKAIIFPVLNGLKEVHAQQFLHRDIKPGNIFMRKNGSPMLIDFGAARYDMGSKSKSITQILTPGYAPTEQYRSDASKQGPFTDIYAIGAVMYKMITGQTPPHASDRSEDVYQDGNPDPLIAAVECGKKEYSQPFLEAIDKALSIRSQDRPQTVEAFKEILEKGTSLNQQKEEEKTEVLDKKKEEDQQKKGGALPWVIGVVALAVLGAAGFSVYNDKDNKNIQTKAEKQTLLASENDAEKRQAEALRKENALKDQQEKIEKEKKRLEAQKEALRLAEKSNRWKKEDLVVVDTKLKLMWQDNFDVKYNNYDHSTASAYCDQMTLLGHNNWRLPTTSELETLIIKVNGKINLPTSFEYAPKDFFWSSQKGGTGSFLGLDYKTGELSDEIHSVKEKVRCVRDNDTSISNTQTLKKIFRDSQINDFLTNFVEVGEINSISKLVDYYDSVVSPYFRISRATRSDIYSDKDAYNKRWTTREYQLLSYNILDRYKKSDGMYCDVEYRVSWKVSNENKMKSGDSKLLLSLKSDSRGYKITSISNLKINTITDKTINKDKTVYFDDNGIKIIFKYPRHVKAGDSFILEAEMINNNQNAKQGGLTLSFPDMKSMGGEAVSNNFSSLKGYRTGKKIYNNYQKRAVPSEYFMIEGWQSEKWYYGRTKYFSVRLNAPYGLDALRVNLRGILWITGSRNTRKIPEYSSRYDQQGFPVKHFSIDITR